jgi:hypothetical protein
MIVAVTFLGLVCSLGLPRDCEGIQLDMASYAACKDYGRDRHAHYRTIPNRKLVWYECNVKRG